MARENDAGQASVVPSEEQHHVQAALRVMTNEWAKAEAKARESNNALDWSVADLLQSVAARVRSGEIKADKAVVVLVDSEEDTALTCAAGTLSSLEQRGILASVILE